MDRLTTSKETIQKLLNKFPDVVDVYKFIDELILYSKVELGSKEIEGGGIYYR